MHLNYSVHNKRSKHIISTSIEHHMWQLYNILLSFHSINAGVHKELRLSNYACTQGNHPWLTLNMTQKYTNLWTKTYPMPAVGMEVFEIQQYPLLQGIQGLVLVQLNGMYLKNSLRPLQKNLLTIILLSLMRLPNKSALVPVLNHKFSLLIQILCRENDHLHSMKILKLSQSAKPKWSQKSDGELFYPCRLSIWPIITTLIYCTYTLSQLHEHSI